MYSLFISLLLRLVSLTRLKATVLLNTNVAFLAIPALLPSSSNASVPLHNSSPSQIANLLSIITSMSSIIAGLALLRQNQTKSKDTAEDEVSSLVTVFTNGFPVLMGYCQTSHLQKLDGERFGLEPTAIMFSLPFAFLMWG